MQYTIGGRICTYKAICRAVTDDDALDHCQFWVPSKFSVHTEIYQIHQKPKDTEDCDTEFNPKTHNVSIPNKFILSKHFAEAESLDKKRDFNNNIYELDNEPNTKQSNIINIRSCTFWGGIKYNESVDKNALSSENGYQKAGFKKFTVKSVIDSDQHRQHFPTQKSNKYGIGIFKHLTALKRVYYPTRR